MTSDERPLPAPPTAQVASEPPWPGPVLVLAPHPDDESAGVGGAIALHVRRGDAVTVVFVTNGVNGDPTGAVPPEDYVALRRAEAEMACDRLGVGSREFLGFPDGCAVTESDLAAVTDHLHDALLRHRPAVVYLPHEGESHADHHFVARAARAAAARLPRPPVLVAYEVWSPQPAGWVLDVTPVYRVKRAALGCYQSQLEHTDILAAIEALNAYRAILLPPGGGAASRRAEVFRVLT